MQDNTEKEKIPDSNFAWIRTARLIKENLSEIAPLGRLPPLLALASRYRVSRNTVLRSLRYLRDQGVVRFSQGSAIYTQSAENGQPANPAPDAHRPERQLLNRIQSGYYPTGSVLPKMLVLAQDFGISQPTVSRLCKRFADAGIIYREERAYVVGRRGDFHGPTKKAGHRPVVLILTMRQKRWDGLYNSLRTRMYVDVILNEAEKHGVDLILVELHSQVGSGAVPDSERNDVILEAAQRHGDRCLGILFADLLRELDNPYERFNSITAANLPVVWFDRSDEGFPVGLHASKRMFRCHYSESAFSRAALLHLHEKGHRTVVFLGVREGIGSDLSWQTRRSSMLIDIVSRDFPDMEIRNRLVSVNCDDPHIVLAESDRLFKKPFCAKLQESIAWFAAHREALLQTFDARPTSLSDEHPFAGFFACYFSKNPGEGPFSVQAARHMKVAHAALALQPCFEDPRISAVIAPNDDLAYRYHLGWFDTLEMPVPEHMSIIAFDNAFRNSFIRLNSVDPNFRQLGYKSFHLMMNDIPIATSADGDICIDPFVSDRGSVSTIGPD